ncbi:MAG: hypothetical protein AAFV59_14285 [Pseudomonadota bacterium]
MKKDQSHLSIKSHVQLKHCSNAELRSYAQNLELETAACRQHKKEVELYVQGRRDSIQKSQLGQYGSLLGLGIGALALGLESQTGYILATGSLVASGIGLVATKAHERNQVSALRDLESILLTIGRRYADLIGAAELLKAEAKSRIKQ